MCWFLPRFFKLRLYSIHTLSVLYLYSICTLYVLCLQDVLKARTSTYKAVVKAFGTRVVGEDGEINRTLLAETVFSDAEQRRRLNK